MAAISLYTAHEYDPEAEKVMDMCDCTQGESCEICILTEQEAVNEYGCNNPQCNRYHPDAKFGCGATEDCCPF